MSTTILVTGGTGRLGRALVPQLLDAGHDVYVLTRREREPTNHVWAVGDLRTGAGVADAVTGAEVIVHLATTKGRGDVDAIRTLIGATRQAHLVYVSIVGVDGAALGYYRAKEECERLVAESGLPWTILRTTQFHQLITAICDAQRMSPVTVMPAKVSFQPIDVSDVAKRLTEIAGGPARGRVADLGGPEIRSAAELARTYLQAIRRRRPVWSVALPGKAMQDYRAGRHLTPERAVGRITFDEFLTRLT